MNLLITHRTVPLDRWDEYVAAWRAFAADARALGANTWLFRRAGHDDQLVEFLEWRGDDAPQLATDALDAVATGRSDTLEEAGL